MTLPSTLAFGVVRDWGGIVSASIDADATPDVSPVVGVVTFTPSVPVQYVSDPVRSRWLTIEPHRFAYDADGILRDAQGNDGVTLIATDSPGLSRQDWQWVATFDTKTRNGPKQIPFELPADTIVDLPDVAPVTVTNGVAITRGLPGVIDDTNLTAILTNPTSSAYAVIAGIVEALGGGGGGSAAVSVIPDLIHSGFYLVPDGSTAAAEDPDHPGFYLVSDTSPYIGEDLDHPGFYLFAVVSSAGGSSFTPVPSHPGLYTMGS